MIPLWIAADLLGTSGQVGRSLLLRCIETSALQNNVNVQLTPRQFSSVRNSIDSNLLAINNDEILTSLNSVLVLTDLAAETTLSGIVLQQVSKHLRACQIVDCYYFITFSLEHLTESEATNTAKAVNSYFCHFTLLFKWVIPKKMSIFYTISVFFSFFGCKVTKKFLYLHSVSF